MVKDHTALLHNETQILQKQHITMSDSPVSQRLVEESRQLVDTLRGKKGKDFDREYIGAQVREHRQLLDMLDDKLIPNAKNADLKTALTQTRAKVEMHLREAEDIMRALTTGGR